MVRSFKGFHIPSRGISRSHPACRVYDPCGGEGVLLISWPRPPGYLPARWKLPRLRRASPFQPAAGPCRTRRPCSWRMMRAPGEPIAANMMHPLGLAAQCIVERFRRHALMEGRIKNRSSAGKINGQTIERSQTRNQIFNTRAVSPLVVIPGDHLDERTIHDLGQSRIENTRVTVSNDIC
jgi:hypothetical protein